MLTRRRLFWPLLVGCGLLTLLWLRPRASAANPFALATILLDYVAGVPSTVTEITHMGDARLLIVQQSGQIRVLANGVLQPTPLLDLSGGVSTDAPERGLLGLAVHPDFAVNGHFFVNYTDLNGDTRVERYTLDAGDPAVADPASARLILSVPQPAANHNGGALRFGPDGYLYISLGDGGGGGDPNDNAQNPDALLGKILRIDVDAGAPYAIPPDNPFAAGGGRPEIWLLGVRNPWRMAFDAVTGDLWLADVGQRTYEEINVLTAADGGANLGWDCFEGNATYPVNASDPGAASPLCPPRGARSFVSPVYTYQHTSTPSRCSITGGQVYRGSRFPEMDGLYFFADFCSRELWALGPAPDHALTALAVDGGLPSQPTAFGSGANGDLYLGLRNGAVYRLRSGAPVAVTLAQPAAIKDAPAAAWLAGALIVTALGAAGVNLCRSCRAR